MNPKFNGVTEVSYYTFQVETGSFAAKEEDSDRIGFDISTGYGSAGK